jgi:formate hydrogenlyase subunit 6/NADH:ubiquinone oxidoreductase subunit I
MREDTNMTMALYYFTGTGNCLAVARSVGARMGCQPISIAEVVDETTIRTDANTIGIIFPDYLSALHGIPLVVERFLCKLEHLESKRLFAICTCGGYEIFNAVPALRNLARFVKQKGGRLSAEYTVRLPMNNLDYEHIPVPIETDSATIIRHAEAQIDEICKRLAQQRRGKHHLARRLVTLLMTPLYALMAKSTMQSLRRVAGEPADSLLGFRELIPLTDRSIQVGEKCTGCGICARVCPVQNIELINGRPVWQHRCEMCFACHEWCPRGAIQHWGRPDGAKYHHPEIGARDLFRRSSSPQSHLADR